MFYKNDIEPNTIWTNVGTLNEDIQSDQSFIDLFKKSKYTCHIECNSMKQWEKEMMKSFIDGSSPQSDNLEAWIVDPCNYNTHRQKTSKL